MEFFFSSRLDLISPLARGSVVEHNLNASNDAWVASDLETIRFLFCFAPLAEVGDESLERWDGSCGSSHVLSRF